ncbi:MAG TPA: hypothetical protein IAC31_05045 [Candidatus Faecousia intestinigallinarum]|nr:hypothetical protein [Candidatus Faecousia intestinigallinarum]
MQSKRNIPAAMLLLLAFALALAACAPAEAPTPTADATQPTTLGTEAPTQTPTEIPTEPEALDYDAYFSQIRGKEYLETGFKVLSNPDYLQDRDWRLDIADEEMLEERKWEDAWRNYPVILSASNKALVKVLSELPVRSLSAEPDFAVAVNADGTELWKLDYDTGEAETLYTDPSGQLCDPIEYYDGCVFFLAGNGADGRGLYRLYLPEMKLDLMAEDLPAERPDGYRFQGFQVISNHEVAWVYTYPVFEHYAQEYWDEPVLGQEGDRYTPKEAFGEIYAEDPPETVDDLSKTGQWQYAEQLDWVFLEKTGQYSADHWYRNTLTGEERMCYSFVIHNSKMPVYYPDGTMRPEAEWENGSLWWLDSYYTAG